MLLVTEVEVDYEGDLVRHAERGTLLYGETVLCVRGHRPDGFEFAATLKNVDGPTLVELALRFDDRLHWMDPDPEEPTLAAGRLLGMILDDFAGLDDAGSVFTALAEFVKKFDGDRVVLTVESEDGENVSRVRFERYRLQECRPVTMNVPPSTKGRQD